MNRSSLVEQATFAKERAKEYVSSAGGVISKARSLVSGDALFFATVPKIDDLRHGLAADSIFDKRDVMKRIVAQMCKGADMHCLFPDVVKNIHVPSIEMRKLVYLFILQYAEQCPNETLLSVSAFQRDLADPSMHVRALALRMLSSIRIPAIHPVVMVAVRRGAADMSAVVRKTAAIALRQMHSVTRGALDRAAVQDILRTLLVDKETDVVGAAVYSLEAVLGPREQELLLHPVYRSLCRTLVECEEWGQVVLLRVLLRYARAQFNDPALPRPRATTSVGEADSQAATSSAGAPRDAQEEGEVDHAAASSESSSSSDTEESLYAAKATPGPASASDQLDPDHVLLLQSAKPLLRSLNSAVVVGVCALYYHCAPAHYLDYCVKPLIRVLGNAAEGQSVVLHTIHTVLLARPEAFVPYIREFYVLPHDAADVQRHKLHILARLVTRDNFADVCGEFRAYMRSYSESATVAAVRGFASVALRQPEYASQVVRLLTPLLSHQRASVMAEAVAVLRVLFAQCDDKALTSRLVFRLMRQVMQGGVARPQKGGSAPATPSALATIVWLVGENIALHPALATAAPDCFRVFVRQFTTLESAVRIEVLVLGCKIWLHLAPAARADAPPGVVGDDTGDAHAAAGGRPMAVRFRAMYDHALELARYDEDYQIRDLARLLANSLDREGAGYALLKSVLLGEKPLPCAPSLHVEHNTLELGTLSHLFQRPVLSYTALPPWSTMPTDDECRTALRMPTSERGGVADTPSTSLSSASSTLSSSTYTASEGDYTASETETASETDSSASTSPSTADTPVREATEPDNGIGATIDDALGTPVQSDAPRDTAECGDGARTAAQT